MVRPGSRGDRGRSFQDDTCCTRMRDRECGWARRLLLLDAELRLAAGHAEPLGRRLAESRARARAAIEAGGVRADGALVAKPSDLIADAAVLEVTPAYPWVSRGGVKLAHALDEFHVDPAGRVCLDVGAST